METKEIVKKQILEEKMMSEKYQTYKKGRDTKEKRHLVSFCLWYPMPPAPKRQICVIYWLVMESRQSLNGAADMASIFLL
jgi:hypothetical protein